MTPFRATFRNGWGPLSGPHLVSTAVAAGGLMAAIFGFNGGFFSFLKYLAVLAGVYLVFGLIGWWRDRLLWSLRNRLMVAYLFIAVVPILSVVTLAILAGRILYSQLGAYLLHEDLQQRIAMIADISEHIAAAHANLPRGIDEEESERVLASQSHSVHDRELPRLSIAFSNDANLLRKVAGPGAQSFSGIVQEGNRQEGDRLSLMSIRAMPERERVRVVTLRVPVTPGFLSGIAPDLGAIQLSFKGKYRPGARKGIIYPT